MKFCLEIKINKQVNIYTGAFFFNAINVKTKNRLQKNVCLYPSDFLKLEYKKTFLRVVKLNTNITRSLLRIRTDYLTQSSDYLRWENNE